MSDIRQLNVGSELNSSSDEDLGIFSAFRKELEVLVIRTIEKLIGPALEPLIRNIVKENIDLAQERIIAMLNQSSGERPSSSSSIKLKLRFEKKLSLPILTGKPILGEDGNPLKIELIDENTNLVIKTVPQSSGRVEILALRVNTRRGETDANGNTSILNGCTVLDLSQGIGIVETISFPQRSTWTRKRKCVLVARFVDEVGDSSVIEAKSEVFTLKDKRNGNYGKHHPPSLPDKVLHLVNIGKGGPYEKNLMDKNIKTVKDLLTEFFKNPQNLKEIVKMPEMKFNETIIHAFTCEELKEKYLYYIPGSEQQKGIVLNIVGEPFGLIYKHQYVPVDNLSEIQKDKGKKMVASALENWGHVVRFNEHSFPSSSSHSVPRDPPLSVAIYDNTHPSTSSILDFSPPIPIGPSQPYDHTQPSTSHVNDTYSLTPPYSSGTLSDSLSGSSVFISGYDHIQNPSNIFYANSTMPNNFVGTSLINNEYHHTQPNTYMFSPDGSNVTSHDKSQYEERQIADPEDITPLHSTYSYPFEGIPNGYDMGFGLLDDSQWGSIISEDYMYNPGFSIDDIFGPDERLNKDMLSKAWKKKWRKLIFVTRFTLKLDKSGHVRKRTRCN